MPISITLETGAGVAGANSYASVDECNTYHSGHLYSDYWDAGTSDRRNRALVMATRVIDAEVEFFGVRTHEGQKLCWPRTNCPDRETGGLVPATSIPKNLKDATCELARWLLFEDRTTGKPLGEGLKFTSMAGLQQSFDKNDRQPPLSQIMAAMLSGLGTMKWKKSGSVKLTRA